MLFRRKKRIDFYSMLIDHAQAVDDCVQALLEYCDDPSQTNGDIVGEMEGRADYARKILVDEINASFITPIDREDLFRLSNSIDDLADYAWNTVRELRIYDLDPDAATKELVGIMKEMSEGILFCTQLLEKDHRTCAEIARRVKKMQNRMNTRYHESIAELFKSDDIKMILKYRTIYRHLDHGSDRGNHTADILLDIVVKL